MVVRAERSLIMVGRGETAVTEAIQEAAIAWLVRVQSDRADGSDWAELTLWLEASPDHQKAFEAVERLSAQITEDSEPLRRAFPAPPSNIVRLRPRSTWRTRLTLGGALAVASLAAAFMLGPVLMRASQGVNATYRTGRGETRTVTLADGTHIQMDAASTLSARLGWRERHVDLGDAEASFDVAKDPRRPFTISVGDQQVRVVGTQFNIRHYDGATVITVRRGVVEIDQASQGAAPLARLTRNWQWRHKDGSDQSSKAQVDADPAFAWAQGQLVCDDQPVSEIVAYLNRRYQTPIQISETAGARRFSGVLQLDDQSQVVRDLARYLSLSAHRSDGKYTLG